MKRFTYILVAIALAVSALWFLRKGIYQFVATDHVNDKVENLELTDM